jgi:hypothetical protein
VVRSGFAYSTRDYQPTSQSSPGRCPRFFTRTHHDFVFVFRFPQRSLLPLQCFIFTGQLRGSHSLLSVRRARFGFLGLVPAWSASISAPQFLLQLDPSFVLGPHVLGLAAANFCGRSVLLWARSQQIWSRARRSESPSSVCFISSSKTSSFVLDLISAEFLSLLMSCHYFLFAFFSST